MNDDTVMAFEDFDSSRELAARLLSTLDESRRITPPMKRAIRDFLQDQNSVRKLMRDIVREVGSVSTSPEDTNPGRYIHTGTHGDEVQVRTAMTFYEPDEPVIIEFRILEDTSTVVGWTINP